MRPFWFLAVGCLVLPAVLAAGQIFGAITSGGKGVAGAAIAIDCGGTVIGGATLNDGSYRIPHPKEGRCTLTLTGYPGASAVVFSYPNPAQNDFELLRQPDGRFSLRKR